MKKIILMAFCSLGLIGIVGAQTSLTGNSSNLEPSVTIESLLNRLEHIGTTAGSVRDYFTPQEQRMLNVHFNGIGRLAPRVITQSLSQTITPGEQIGCNTLTHFTDNKLYRAFDLPGEFGITEGFQVTAVEFAIGTISTPTGFPITANIYSNVPGSFPGGTLTLRGTAVYTASNADEGMIVSLPISALIPPGQGMVMELVLVDDGTDTNLVRFGCNSEGQTGPSYLYSESCNIFEITTLLDLGYEQGYVWNVLGDDEPVFPVDNSNVFGINNASATLVTFAPSDPSILTPLGASPAPNFENAGAIDPSDPSTAYVLDNGGDFYSVNLSSGAYTSLGSITPPNSENWSGAEFSPNGTLYAISTSVSSSTLSTIDIAGVSSTVIGNTEIEGAISLMIDDAGQGYTHDIASDNFFKVDLSNGSSTLVGPLGFDANFGQGGTYIQADPGFVYISAFDAGSFQSQWRKVDVTTGASTIIGLFNGGSDQVAWSSVVQDLVGIEDNVLTGFSFYPNPTSGIVSLKSVKNITSVALYNLLGQKLMSFKVDSTTSELDISRLNVGSYIMQVLIDGQTGTYKILKD
ncbi:T9SS type A sorting domain-containing protein [Aequorivita sp. H23M31]|uniref:T9SS type A sorting domain-containing protein n=1 Tax=Aequorivita ciconiae TaxID=2494375 RepID=A0A410FZE2_9FLAO|nr:T9SS type A sorting domain-containing protein [Aequorivita sp. H23M31]QAA80395.1 T9SS type A sorting domain-containing protein [Aequorivita sp. H23M31]